MAVRYSQKEKDKIIAFVNEYNEKNKRGGQTVAAKKFKVSPITVSKWLENAGAKKKKTNKTKAKSAAPKTRRPRAAKKVTSLSSVLGRMQEIQKEIESLQSEYESLKGRL